jgi:hypothetical protein
VIRRNGRATDHEEVPDMNDLTPTAPQGYALVAQVGRGASSVVWEAQRLADGRPMALKILDADVSDPDAVRRFEREREAMTALAQHPHILTIADAGVQGTRPWLAMELCRRGSLAAYVADGGPLDVPTVITVLDRLAGALAVAHDAGVVHCDIKPANVMLTDAGEPALGDFGIARVSVGRATTTTVGGFSLDHVAPELLDDAKRSPRSDVYSLGTTAWELLAGHPPFRQSADVSVGTVLTRILRQPLPESDRIPDDVLALLRRMAAKTPEERPSSMREVGDEIRALAERRGIDVNEPAFPAATAVERELAQQPLVNAVAGLVADPTRHRSSAITGEPAVGSRPTVSRSERLPVIAAGVIALLIVGATGIGLYQTLGTPTPTPTPVAVEQAAPPAPSDVPPAAETTAVERVEPVAEPPVAVAAAPRPQRAPAAAVPAAAAPAPNPVPVVGPPPATTRPATTTTTKVVVTTTPTTPPVRPKYDPNGDGKLSCADQKFLVAQWGKSGAGDLNGNGTVDITDMSMLLSEMGKARVGCD